MTVILILLLPTNTEHHISETETEILLSGKTIYHLLVMAATGEFLSVILTMMVLKIWLLSAVQVLIRFMSGNGIKPQANGIIYQAVCPLQVISRLFSFAT